MIIGRYSITSVLLFLILQRPNCYHMFSEITRNLLQKLKAQNKTGLIYLVFNKNNHKIFCSQ